eukprot:1669220-Amphidinium_carterae.1
MNKLLFQGFPLPGSIFLDYGINIIMPFRLVCLANVGGLLTQSTGRLNLATHARLRLSSAIVATLKNGTQITIGYHPHQH